MYTVDTSYIIICVYDVHISSAIQDCHIMYGLSFPCVGIVPEQWPRVQKRYCHVLFVYCASWFSHASINCACSFHSHFMNQTLF